MKNTQIMPTYPWPYIASPHRDSLQDEEIFWYDTDFTFMSKATREKYKRHGLASAAAYMSPTTTDLSRLRPITLLMIWMTLFDDYYEFCPKDKLEPIRDHIINIILGKQPDSDDIGLVRQAAQMVKELRTFMPDFWMERFANSFYRYVTYGLMEEIPYKLAKIKHYPPLAVLLPIREYSVAMHPYLDMLDVSLGFILSANLYNHPIIQRFRAITARLAVIQNDFASLEKEKALGAEVFNIVLVIQHEYKISLEEAINKSLHIHDEYVREMDALHAALPDFGPYHKNVDNYIFHMKLMLTGIGKWYQDVTERYTKFPIPEY
ncbi:hypothetical protein ATE47_10460 [Chryseobacterium sp. IHB B 17019]|uniref:terpene synthase family protein n=1 Tax=Chryseobacterium sp. IHB B 17019 TaxID=1721091 RepID=UPI00072128E3|nr:hypothetical protein [Chryseobacterium sp. IHB B 17019]ALR30925.1 hypothetical protein ATE47_10460 [Chryseobacterium sp. IHB B 17019]